MTPTPPQLPDAVLMCIRLLHGLEVQLYELERQPDIVAKNVDIWIGHVCEKMMEYYKVPQPDFLKLWRPIFGTLTLTGSAFTWANRSDGAPTKVFEMYNSLPVMTVFMEVVLRATVMINLQIPNFSSYVNIHETPQFSKYKPFRLDGTYIGDCVSIDAANGTCEILVRNEKGQPVTAAGSFVYNTIKIPCYAYSDPNERGFF